MDDKSYKQKIGMALGLVGISQAELARRVGMTPQNFSKKAKRSDFTQGELIKIAEAFGAEFRCAFIFPDGTEI